MRRLAAVSLVLLVAVVPAGEALAASAPPPAGLPLPAGLRLVRARAGDATTAFTWSASYASGARARDLARYAAALRRRGVAVTTGPGDALTFPFRRWQVFACADPGCGAPRGRITVVVAVPGG